MIQANELRIVNILNYQTAEGDIISTTLDWQDIKWISEDKKGFNLCHSPIQLTEEWLLKFGFVKMDEKHNFFIHGYEINFKVDKKLKWGAWCNNVLAGVEIQYVHQLQNLFFVLTGKELEVKL